MNYILIKVELYKNRKLVDNTLLSNSWNYTQAKWNLFKDNLEILQNININYDIQINEYWQIIF